MEFRGLTLDPFQVEAIQAVEAGKSVIVAAPTGSGKTIVADFVISKEFNSGRKVVYTAPIKALSNQKYRDFCRDYGEEHVGLVTGDVVIRPEADILVMTTEVYRNMAVSHDPDIARVSHLVFDEIHYINDIERGTVWEEAVIFSPAQVRFVCLSATVPNADEMGRWIERIKGHEVVVVRHEERAVPLQQWLYDAEFGLCTMSRLQQVIDIPDYSYVSGRRRKRRPDARKPAHYDIVDELERRQLLPCIYFVFSRKDCERMAEDLARRKNFGRAEGAFASLSQEMRSLQSTARIRSVCAKGVAYHHAGMLPAAKHAVEELFAAGKIRVLYATETFAVGVNMPARTVVLDSVRKFDGVSVRNMTPREYAQLSGRAGRRGIDSEGNVVVSVDRRSFDVMGMKRITGRDTQPVRSQFRLSVNTALNLMKRHAKEDIPGVLARTFWSFQEKKGKAVVERQFANLQKLLERGGYVKGGVLTVKGEFASHIYCDEMVLAELLAAGCPFDSYQLLLVFAALAYEGREQDHFYRPKENRSSRELEHAVRGLAAQEKKLKSIRKLTSIMRPCWDDMKFHRLLRESTLPEGELAKLFTQVMDRMRQVRKASRDRVLRERIDGALGKVSACLEGIDVL